MPKVKRHARRPVTLVEALEWGAVCLDLMADRFEVMGERYRERDVLRAAQLLRDDAENHAVEED